MEAIYNTQDFWRIESYYSESPGTISQAFIKYLKPDGITLGEFSATNDTVNLMFYKEGSLEEYLEAGKWTVWNKAVMSDGRVVFGSKWTFTVQEEIPSGTVCYGNCY